MFLAYREEPLKQDVVVILGIGTEPYIVNVCLDLSSSPRKILINRSPS